uniref:Uncharacterized protein n=1 Tax=Globodera rostochiensis TaxID=31243 RepID=A0A914H5N2_GLORO
MKKISIAFSAMRTYRSELQERIPSNDISQRTSTKKMQKQQTQQKESQHLRILQRQRALNFKRQRRKEHLLSISASTISRSLLPTVFLRPDSSKKFFQIPPLPKNTLVRKKRQQRLFQEYLHNFRFALSFRNCHPCKLMRGNLITVGSGGLHSQLQLDHEEIIELASEYAPDMTDALFDEISMVNQILKEVSEAEFEQLTTEQWQRIFNADLPFMYKLVSKFLSNPHNGRMSAIL